MKRILNKIKRIMSPIRRGKVGAGDLSQNRRFLEIAPETRAEARRDDISVSLIAMHGAQQTARASGFYGLADALGELMDREIGAKK